MADITGVASGADDKAAGVNDLQATAATTANAPGDGQQQHQPGIKGARVSTGTVAADDDDDDDDEEGVVGGGGGTGKVNRGKTGRERRKIEIKFIQDKSRRHITFSKRKAGIMKKVCIL